MSVWNRSRREAMSAHGSSSCFAIAKSESAHKSRRHSCCNGDVTTPTSFRPRVAFAIRFAAVLRLRAGFPFRGSVARCYLYVWFLVEHCRISTLSNPPCFMATRGRCSDGKRYRTGGSIQRYAERDAMIGRHRKTDKRRAHEDSWCLTDRSRVGKCPGMLALTRSVVWTRES